jgi:hypothetical protein
MSKDSESWPYSPESGWIYGQERIAAAAGFRSAHYFMEVIREDPRAAFIIAIGPVSDTSVNSVPPGQLFLIITLPNSLDAWRQRRENRIAANRDTSGLIRWEKTPTDVSGGSVR